MMLPARRLWPALLTALWAVDAQAAEPLLKLTDVQQKAAGLVIELVRKADDPISGVVQGQLLPGRVVVPNSRRETLLSGLGGRVEAVLVSPGQTVRAGQELLRLYSAEFVSLQRSYLTARSAHDLARKRLTRDETLFADGIIAESRLQDSRDMAQQAAAAEQEQTQLLRLAGLSKASLEKLRTSGELSASLTLYAARAGLVIDLPVTTGSAVDTGTLLAQLALTDLLWVELQATREQLASIATGDQVQVDGCPSKGTVVAAGGQLDASTQTGLVRAAFTSVARCLSPGQFVQGRLSPSAPPAGSVVVSGEAVVQRGGKDFVFVAAEGGFRAVPVQVLRRQGAATVLSTGVNAGTRVAGKGLAALKGSWMGLGAAAAGTE